MQNAVIEFPRCNHDIPNNAKFCPECGAQNIPFSLDDKIAEYIKSNSEILYAIDEEGNSAESCKWYDHEKDMREMSKSFKNVLFTLHGDGEENGDIWNEYHMNGKCQVEKASFVIGEFDKSKLK